MFWNFEFEKLWKLEPRKLQLEKVDVYTRFFQFSFPGVTEKLRVRVWAAKVGKKE